jgi:hypothetical protein
MSPSTSLSFSDFRSRFPSPSTAASNPLYVACYEIAHRTEWLSFFLLAQRFLREDPSLLDQQLCIPSIKIDSIQRMPLSFFTAVRAVLGRDISTSAKWDLCDLSELSIHHFFSIHSAIASAIVDPAVTVFSSPFPNSFPYIQPSFVFIYSDPIPSCPPLCPTLLTVPATLTSFIVYRRGHFHLILVSESDAVVLSAGSTRRLDATFDTGSVTCAAFYTLRPWFPSRLVIPSAFAEAQPRPQGMLAEFSNLAASHYRDLPILEGLSSVREYALDQNLYLAPFSDILGADISSLLSAVARLTQSDDRRIDTVHQLRIRLVLWASLIAELQETTFQEFRRVAAGILLRTPDVPSVARNCSLLVIRWALRRLQQIPDRDRLWLLKACSMPFGKEVVVQELAKIGIESGEEYQHWDCDRSGPIEEVLPSVSPKIEFRSVEQMCARFQIAIEKMAREVGTTPEEVVAEEIVVKKRFTDYAALHSATRPMWLD